MVQKKAQNILRSTEISEEERKAARTAIYAFKDFLKKLWAARQHDKRLVFVRQGIPARFPRCTVPGCPVLLLPEKRHHPP